MNLENNSQHWFNAIIDGENVRLIGETWHEALKNQGYEVETKYTSGKSYVGKLTNGKRYNINFQPRKDKIRFCKPIAMITKTELKESMLKKSRRVAYSLRGKK